MLQGNPAPNAQTPSPAESEAQAVGAAIGEHHAALQLLKIEGELRDAASVHELLVAVSTQSRGLMRTRQIFAVELTGDAFVVKAISGLPTVDRNAPLVSWLEHLLARAHGDVDLASAQQFQLQAYTDASNDHGLTFPFREAQWVPIIGRRKELLAGLLMVRELPWRESDFVVAKRLAATTGHAWRALQAATWHLPQPSRRSIACAVVAAICLAFLPVSMSTLAPLEIAPRAPYIVTAGLDGVIESVDVAPNMTVSTGDALVRFVDTNLRSRLAVAEREVSVADARLRKLSLQSFTDVRGRHDLGIARAELAIKTTERELAREQLGRSRINAPKAGIAVFGDARDLIGRPVATGEKLMEIADPRRVEIRIDVPVSDSIILAPGARVTGYLDSAPLRPVSAIVVRADYQARARDNGMMAYRVVAELADAHAPPPRLGIRGTAQLYGNSVSLGFYLLRRPISALRQWVGV